MIVNSSYSLGMPSAKNIYVFNGDYVDRGFHGPEVLFIVYALCLGKSFKSFLRIDSPLNFTQQSLIQSFNLNRSTHSLKLTQTHQTSKCDRICFVCSFVLIFFDVGGLL
jgi:hypothetical protein